MTGDDQNPNNGLPHIPDIDVGRTILKSLLSDDFEDEHDGSSLPRLHGYMLLQRLGAGGGGEVYCAAREGADQLYAVKIIRHGLRDPRLAQRAWSELDLLSRTHLPCLPRVHDYGVHEGRLYIVTDFIDGLPLDQYCDRNGLGCRERVRLLADVAEAVQSLHERLILHRDLKSANILIDAAGRVWIVDLGIARMMDAAAAAADAPPPAGSERVGSPAYMAPEQARGDREGISTRTDVYSLAATALVVLTGRAPHDVSGPADRIMQRVAHEPVRPVRELAPRLPRPLADVLTTGLHLHAEQRIATAGAFAADLRRFLNREPVRSVPVPWWSRAWLTVRRRPLAATLLAAAVPVLVLILIAYSNARIAAERQRLLKEHAATMQGVGQRVNHLIESGRIEESLVPLAALADYVRAGGDLEDGLITFSANLEELASGSDGAAARPHPPEDEAQ